MIKLYTVIIFICINIPFIISQVGCNQSCPGSIFNQVPYPFGFSSTCEIQLNCTSNGTVLINEFPVQQINSDELIVIISTTCGRPINALRHLYSQNYAITSTSAILIENCTAETSNCNLPVQLPQFRSAIVNCSTVGYGNMSCYVGDVRNNMFLDYGNVTSLGCKYFLTGFVSQRIGGVGPAPSTTRAVKLGWWVKGSCDCADGADCTPIVSPTDGGDGYRCQCTSELNRDGYKLGSGCFKLKGGSKNNSLTIVLPIIGVVIAGFAIGFGIFLCKRRKKRLRENPKSSNHDIETFISKYGSLGPKRFKYLEIQKMTKSFQEKLGRGGYGTVYKGELSDGELVAVKLLNEATGDGEDFINEVASIGRTSHVNIVTLVGFCIEEKKRALLYEFMPNGSLDKFLRGDGSHLDCKTLFQIAKGIARGLEYLHQGCNTRIVHFDIKPHNVLLDEEFVPKIADFGLAKLCKRKESIVSVMGARGTAGYMAPEVFFRSFGGASHKSDVYSYGMMVLEMTGAHKYNKVSSSITSEAYFPDWVYKQIEEGSNLRGHGMITEYEEELAKKMMMVSLWCIQSDPSDRPSISKVVEMLEGSFELLQVPPTRFWPSSPSRPAPSATQSSSGHQEYIVEDFSTLPKAK